MSENKKKTTLQIALEKDCIILVAANMIATGMPRKEEMSVKCRGAECAQFDIFTTRCGFSK